MAEGGNGTDPADIYQPIECGWCNRSVVAKQIARVIQEAGDDYIVTCILECPACNGAIVTTFIAISYGGGEYEETAPERVYPNPTRELGTDTPLGVRRDFAEAQRCYRAGAFSAAAVMVRRAIEGIVVALNGPANRSLTAGLKALREKELIDDRLASWAHSLRVLGNAAAHQSGLEVSREDATDVLTFVEALADYLFTYRARYEAFRARHADDPPPELQPTDERRTDW